MIIVVTGTPGVGKTTVSKLLAERLGYNYVSIKEFAAEKGIGEAVEGELEIDVDELAKVKKEKVSLAMEEAKLVRILKQNGVSVGT